ncbi:hypothetical protein HanPI659440_Chr09g0346231 [Helianthus annuus]|nr:hypothetical protein HanPI659440_Chr09g0346231 [Helianthus annuus]
MFLTKLTTCVCSVDEGRHSCSNRSSRSGIGNFNSKSNESIHLLTQLISLLHHLLNFTFIKLNHFIKFMIKSSKEHKLKISSFL